MSSLVTRSPSNDEQPLSLAEIASAVYNIDNHPFEYTDLTFDELPQTAQKFLTETAGLFALSTESFDPIVYFPAMLQVRQACQERLGRTLEGVNRALVAGMHAANPRLYSITNDDFNRLPNLQSVLVPEWQSHLDAYVEEIDALIWFEMATRLDTPYAQSPEQVLRERDEDVHRMLEFVLQRLQMTNEKVKREIRGEMVMERILQSMGDEQGIFPQDEPMGHISDGESDFDGSEASWWMGTDATHSPIEGGAIN